MDLIVIVYMGNIDLFSIGVYVIFFVYFIDKLNGDVFNVILLFISNLNVREIIYVRSVY